MLCLVFSRHLIKLAIIFKVILKKQKCYGFHYFENSGHYMTDTKKKIKPRIQPEKNLANLSLVSILV